MPIKTTTSAVYPSASSTAESSTNPQVTTQVKTGTETIFAGQEGRKIYLAGDLVFRTGALALFDTLKGICQEYGLTGISPFDGQEDVKALAPGRDTILTIVKADRALMDECDAGLFCIDPFRRSADMDPGTAVEIGYMHAQGKPMEGYTVDGRNYPDKVADYWKHAWGESLRARAGNNELGSGDDEDTDGMLAHSDGMRQNGMVEGFIVLSGGDVAVNEHFETAFRQAVARLADRIGN
ncbi:nucleoside 2-deoxyribosyltransferase [Halomonadaceae bacterium LMG 33818]|uniref:nucleoside 2-deoxyribosyltransferase n=1 Tax=Cernens ardua TaxID=3402176 RepID=UPI003EDBCBDD